MTDRHTPPPGLGPGDPVRLQFTKWDGSEHWGADLLWLGEDEHGWWLGDPVGNPWSRPGAAFTSLALNVLLAPRDRGFTSMHYGHHPDWLFRLYADVTTAPGWDGETLTCVDLDLDVIQRFDGGVFVDDEDEFAEHQVRYGYPPDLVGEAERECARLQCDIESGAAWTSEALVERWRQLLGRLVPRA